MKCRLNKIYFLCFIFVFSNLYPSIGFAAIDLPWSTTFDCAEWSNWNGSTWVNLTCDGLTANGNWDCGSGYFWDEDITTPANHPAGVGGRGQRHWMGDGKDNNSGGLRISFTNPEPEFWMRWYMRYQSGFSWAGGKPGYDKWIYIYTDGGHATVPEWWSGQANMAVIGDANYNTGNADWNSTMGGATGDGLWHLYEIHIKMDTNGSNGIVKLWIDKVLFVDESGVDHGTVTGFTHIKVGENGSSPNSGSCQYVDFDDIAISNTGYIGPIAGGGSDILPPSVFISSPTSGQIVSGAITISAGASDNIGVAGVQFKLDGADLGAEDTTSPYSLLWDTGTVLDGSHALSATARDAAGNQTTSSPVTVTTSSNSNVPASPTGLQIVNSQ